MRREAEDDQSRAIKRVELLMTFELPSLLWTAQLHTFILFQANTEEEIANLVISVI